MEDMAIDLKREGLAGLRFELLSLKLFEMSTNLINR